MSDVVLKNLSKFYTADICAVDKVSLEVKDKEFLILVGPSGCGKSTTLRMIAGLEEISSGDILIGGNRINDLEAKDRDIAMVFQNYALYPHMTVYKNMAFGLKIRKYSKKEIDSRVQEAAEILGITDLLDRYPKALSGGQRQRVAVGRAIVRHPQVFLFDEPLSNLDAKLRVQMRMELSRLHERLQSTMIYVTHDQIEAMTMGDRIVVMNNGKIQQADTPMKIYNKPANIFVAGFIGTPPMNFINGIAKNENGENYFQPAVSSADSWNITGLNSELDVSKHLVMGIRPENLQLGDSGQNVFEAEIDIVEPMGAETNIHIKYGDTFMIVRLSPDVQLKTGDKAVFSFDNEDIHLFDKETEDRIN